MSKFHLSSHGSELGSLRDVTMIAKRLGMLYLAQAFLTMAIIVGIFDFGEILGPSVVAKIIFSMFLILFVVTLYLGRSRNVS